jgi:Holliday junction resolvasome RuvABC endonuclease subunit
MIHAVGIDAAFSNMGLARVEIQAWMAVNAWGVTATPTEFRLLQTAREDHKQVRKSSDNLRRAQELHRGLHEFIQGAQFVFVEIPHGGALSASAASALGMAVGILASIPIPVIEVTPTEVKEAVSGRRKGAQPSKAEMIAWAAKKWPGAPWLRHERAGGAGKSTWRAGDLLASNEHLADAMAAVEAGIITPEFKRALALLPPREPKRRITPEWL